MVWWEGPLISDMKLVLVSCSVLVVPRSCHPAPAQSGHPPLQPAADGVGDGGLGGPSGLCVLGLCCRGYPPLAPHLVHCCCQESLQQLFIHDQL